MKSRTIDCIRISTFSLLLFGGFMKTFSQSNQCEYPLPRGGAVACEEGQIAVCMIKEGRAAGLCKTPPSSVTTDAEQDAYRLSIMLGKDINIEELKGNVEYERMLRESRGQAAPRALTSSFTAQYLARDASYYGWKGKISDNIEADVRERIRLNPNDSFPHHQLGALLIYLGRFVEAEAEFRKGDLLAQRTNTLDRARALHGLAVVVFKQGAYAQAEDLFRKSVQLIPWNRNSFAVYSHSLACALAAQHKYLEAATVLSESIPREPFFARSYIFLGTILLDQGRLFEAEAEFRRGIKAARDARGWVDVDAWHSEAHEGLVIALIKQGKYREAEASIEAISRAKSEAWRRLSEGLLLLNQGRQTEAAKQFDLAIGFDPTNPLVQEAVDAARVLRRTGQ